MRGYGFTYKGRHSSTMGVNLLNYTPNSPELREYEDEVDGLPGVIDYGTEYGKRAIDVTMDLTVNDDQFKVRQSQIYQWLKPTQAAGILVFDDVPDRFYFAKLTGLLRPEQIGQYGTFTFTFKCTDPFAYGPERIEEYVITKSPDIKRIVSDGTEPTPPEIILVNTGTTTVPKIILTNEYRLEGG
ncbi:distal tail protein Dit [Paenibacillus pinihumi]|uniref:distal tail protein Dit n=1 Tax=Paenibacillus pinihumi TaxID=669462 RepID=UPI000405E6E9|nr:distal tail protein Dit [Paenibacillus pinihumi]